MENLTDSWKNIRVGRVLFGESADSDREDIIQNWHTGLSTRRSLSVGGVEYLIQEEDFYTFDIIQNWNTALSTRRSLSVGGVEYSIQDEDFYTFDIIQNWHTGLSTRRSLSVGGVEYPIQDEDFYTFEAGKMKIFEDQLQDTEFGYMPENVAACSAWELNSDVPFQDFSRTVNHQCQEIFEDYRSFNESSRLHTSTPVSSRKLPTFRALLATKDKISNYHHKVCNRRDSSLFPMLLNTDFSSTTAATAYNAFKIVGTANTQTLEVREISEETFGACSFSSKGNQPNFQSLDSTIRSGEHINVRIPSQNEARSLNVDELLTVDPEVLTLDVKGKGRLELINKSLTRNLKFKIEFNSKLITVCPLMGSIKSKSKIGLRVSDVSRRVNNNVFTEDVIRITCGNIQKEVHVRIYKVKNKKTIKNRSFKCF